MTQQRVTEKKIDTAKNVRAVKSMLKQIEWLGWRVAWENGFVYKKGKERVKPQGLIISETQRRINKVERFPLAAQQVLGDVSKWKEQMEGLLNRAKYFASLGVPDFEDLKTIGKASPKVQEKQFAELLNLLEAEAICFNNLPVSPCRLLAETNRTSPSSARCEALERYIRSANNSPLASALAALALGTAFDARSPEMRREESKELKAWINRCFQWGQGAREIGKRQLSLDPILLVLLLESNSGTINAGKLLELKDELVYFHLPLAEFRTLLQSGTGSNTIIELAEMLEVFEHIGESLLEYRNLIPEFSDIRTRKKLSKKLEWERSSWLDKLRSTVVKLIATNSAPAPPTVTLSKLLVLIENLFARYSVNRKLASEIVTIAQDALQLDPALRNDFLDILHEFQGSIWIGLASEEPSSEEPASKEPASQEQASREPSSEVATTSADLPDISSKSAWYGGSLYQIYSVLSRMKHPGLVRRAISSDTLTLLCMSDLTDPIRGKKFVEWCERIKFQNYHMAWSLIHTMKVPQWEEIEPLIDGFIRSLERAPEALRPKYFQVIDDFSKKKRELKTDLQTATDFLPRLIEVTEAHESCRCSCYVLMKAALGFGRKLPRLAADLQEWLAQFYSRHAPMEHDHTESIERGCDFAIILIGAMQEGPAWHARCEKQPTGINFIEIMDGIVSTFMLHNIESYSQAITDGLLVLEDNALLTRLTLDKFKTQPHRCIRFIANLGATRKLSGTAKEPFKAIAGYRAKERALAALAVNGYIKAAGAATAISCEGASTDIRLEMFDRHAIKRLCTKGWTAVVEQSPHLVPDITSYICSRSITKESQEPPQAVRKVLSLKENLEKEKTHLESKLGSLDDASGSEQSVRSRLKNLEERLNDDAGIQQQVKRLLDKQIYHLAVDAEMCALEHVVNEVIRNHLKAIIGAQAKDVVVDSYLLNALLLTQDVEKNKRLLRKLIKAHVDGDKEWRNRIPGNKQFLDKLKGAGTEPEIWLGNHFRTFKLEAIKGGMVTIHLETDALKILEMGNYFDTCLSFGGENSFSTVTNAVDLNKRVIYAFDKQGTAIGRKLIGINAEGNLIGYRTYTSVEEDEGYLGVRKLINDYVKAFAKMCNLNLAAVGTIPSLATKFWYDDGVEGWSEDEPEGSGETVGQREGDGAGTSVRSKTVEKRRGCKLRQESSLSKSLEAHTQV
jgi:hypothetical protein